MSRQFGLPKASRYFEKIARATRPAIWEQFKFRGHEILWDPKKEVKSVKPKLGQFVAVDGNRHLHK